MKRRNDGINVHGKRPAFQLYPKDLEEELSMLSLAAGGLWTRMFLASHFAPRRGYLELPSGEPMLNEDIARRFGQTVGVVQKLLKEMEHVGTFSRDDRGCIFNRRMVRDEAISQQRRAAAQKRWSANDGTEHKVCSDFAYAKEDAKTMQKHPSSYSSSYSPSGYSLNSSFADWIAKLRDQHPNPSQFQVGVQLLAERPTSEIETWRKHFAEVHAEWCKYWMREKGGRFAPKFGNFVLNFEAYEKGPPKPVDEDGDWEKDLEASA